MRTYLTALTITALLAASSATAAPAPVRTVHLYGDSIMKGWGYGAYDVDSPLNRVDEIATLLARANGSTLRFNRTTVQAPSLICMAVRAGTIKPTDTIVFEDAGPRHTTATERQAWLEHVVKCATRYRGRTAGRQVAPATRLILSTMFDYDPNPVTVPNSTYDTLMDDGRTANDVARQVARRSGSRLLDWNTLMDTRQAVLPELRLVHEDGIHPTIFGNVVMAASLLRREGVQVRNLAPLVDAFEADRGRIVGRFAPEFDRATAERWARVLTG